MPLHWSDQDVDELLVELNAARDYGHAQALREGGVAAMEERALAVPDTQHRVKGLYPYDEGDVTVIGPECFASEDGSVLCWRGVNYVPQHSPVSVRPQMPSIGRTVWYRSRTGAYTVPAIITATQETLARGAVEAGIIPALSSPTHAHLTVFSPGIPEKGPNSDMRQQGWQESPRVTRALPPGAASYNLAGTYQEWDVPLFDPAGDRVSCAPTNIDPADALTQPGGTWTWPVIR